MRVCAGSRGWGARAPEAHICDLGGARAIASVRLESSALGSRGVVSTKLRALSCFAWTHAPALRSAASVGSAADLPPAAEIEAAVVDSRANEREYRELLCALLQLCISLPPKTSCISRRLLFVTQFTSNMGTRVQVDEPKQTPATGGDDSVGVLLLGFGGASYRMLSLHVRPTRALSVVARRHHHRNVSGRARRVECRCDKLMAQQVKDVESGLAGCSKIVLHCMSNNGQAMWLRLLAEALSVVQRVCATVFDCAAAPIRGFPPEALHQVIQQTICAVALLNELPWRPPPE